MIAAPTGPNAPKKCQFSDILKESKFWDEKTSGEMNDHVIKKANPKRPPGDVS